MKTKMPWILLAVSVAFNVFFVAGMVMGRRHREPDKSPERQVQLLTRKLDLDEGQRAQCLALEENVAADHEALKKEFLAEFDKFWAEIIKDNPDETVLQAFVQNAPGPKRRQRFVDHMRGLMKILRPEQRERAAKLFKRHPPWMRRGKPRRHEQ